MAPLDRPKRMLVRTSLVAGSTVATLIGAQTLITLDQQNPAFNKTSTSSTSNVAAQVQSAAIPQQAQAQPAANVVVHALPTIKIVHVAPSISIVRQSGQVASQSVQTVAVQPTAVPAQTVIKPPAPVQIAAPAPIIVQQPAAVSQSNSGGGGGSNQPAPPPPRTSSSR